MLQSQTNEKLGQNDSCIVILAFAETHQFIVQDEVQSFKWKNGQCSIHPAALYYRESETKELKEQLGLYNFWVYI